MPNKIKIYYKFTTEQIIKSIEGINYFCPLSSKKSCYVKDRLTGIIPFSFNFNTPLLLDNETNQIYKLESPILYENSLCEIIENLCNTSFESYDNLVNKTVNEKNKICIRNLEELEKMMI